MSFLDDNFLLTTATARRLYHDYAEALPIIDYHSHVLPSEIYEDRAYDNITEVWLGADHYKWRIMRACGEPERLVTGDGDAYEKFLAFARSLPRAAGNPVYHWAHLELKRYFGCDLPINEKNAPEIWKVTRAALTSGLTVREIIRRSGVVGLATIDDPADTLEWHEKLRDDPTWDIDVRPTWRPDELLLIGGARFAGYIERLGGINTMNDLRLYLLGRMDYFAARGCGASDHGLLSIDRVEATEDELDAILEAAKRGEVLSTRQCAAFRYALMLFLGAEYARRGWVMEMHFGPLRNINSSLAAQVGVDAGLDVISPNISFDGLPAFLNELNSASALPRTILFALSPNFNALLAVIAGCFQEEGIRGKVQQGSAWWFNDTKRGIMEQMASFSDVAPLGVFLGMLTDSRSFLSYTRHEYFRRILCDMVGGWIERGEYADDEESARALVQDVSYNNVKKFFSF